MKQFDISGMSCAACSARVERAVSALDGVSECSVNLLTNSMNVESTLADEVIISAVEGAGYGARARGGEEKRASAADEAKKEKKSLIIRLASSCAVLMVLMYISMGHVMWGFPLPRVMSENPMAIALTEMLLAVIVMLINKRFFINGAKGIFNLSPNMDTLVALGSGAAFVYSTYMLYKMSALCVAGDISSAYHILHSEMYFESAAMILTLITVGKMLEARAKGKTTSAIEALLRLTPKIAHKINDDGTTADVPAEQIKIGERFYVLAGESIPVDAKVLEGVSAVDESMLTGESMPRDLTAGESVFGGTVSRSGYIVCRAESVGEGTVLAGIIKTVREATATKAPIAKVADKVSAVFVPAVMGIALISVIVWLIVSGGDVGYSLARGISVLVISCPCALGLATPVAIMVGGGVGAKNGILFKDAASLESMGKADIVLLDKTGTITEGKPCLTDIFVADGADERELLRVAFSLEAKSEHPLARAVVEYAEKNGVEALDVEAYKTLSGNGVEGEISGDAAYGGSIKFVGSRISLSDEARAAAEAFAAEGKTPVAFVLGTTLLGIIAIADPMRRDSAEGIARLKKMGLFTVMLTGDNKRTADAIGARSGVDYVISDVMPEEKGNVAADMKQFGRVIMVGDGINDAVALTVADVGVAMGAGSHIAIDSASVVLINSGISHLASAIRLSRGTLTNIKENLFWAFAYNVLGIPLAAGAFTALLGWSMSPMIGALAMSLSSFCVVSNALRLNFIKLKGDSGKRRKKHINMCEIEKYFYEKEREKIMEITVKVAGMMCPHCEARVKKSLEANADVIEAYVSHTEGIARVKTTGAIDKAAIEAIITDAGYEVIK